ncbi:hypothetical protein [Streptomyces kronopolitis]|uniref:hypothetical protein n=1 Tax=Streptomyces kronopolitis TaxID=1612435 RepID=UPI003D984E06
MWSGRHTDYLEDTARALAEEIRRVRSRRRAAAVAYGREQVEHSRRIARDADAAERARRAVLGLRPQAAPGPVRRNSVANPGRPGPGCPA